MQGLNFIAIDFETAAESRASVCETGICVVRDGKVTETRSWLVRPVGNRYCYWNTQVHGSCCFCTASIHSAFTSSSDT